MGAVRTVRLERAPAAASRVRRRRAPVSSRRAVVAFAASTLLTLVVLGLVGAFLLERIGRREAIRDAKQLTELAGRGIVAPNLPAGVLTGDPAARAELDRVVRDRVLVDPVVRVKIWTADGRIVYSDEPRLIGERYDLGDEEREALRRGFVEAELSDLTRPENRFERPAGKLLEVYLPIRERDGTPLLFESYQRFSSVAASGRRMVGALAPPLIAALVLLWLVQVPLAWRLSRRLREGQQEREALLQRAVDSSQLERRRIAGDLHDGAVQNLAGVAYALAAAEPDAPPTLAPTLHLTAAETRRTLRELRSLLVEIYPPDLHRAGLEAALRDLVSPFSGRGIDVSLELPPDTDLPVAVEALLFRAAQEAVRNVLAHARATHVRIRLDLGAETAALTVADDGLGFEPEAADTEGHFGLRLLGDLARDAGGTLAVTSAPGEGTTLRIEVPLA